MFKPSKVDTSLLVNRGPSVISSDVRPMADIFLFISWPAVIQARQPIRLSWTVLKWKLYFIIIVSAKTSYLNCRTSSLLHAPNIYFQKISSISQNTNEQNQQKVVNYVEGIVATWRRCVWRSRGLLRFLLVSFTWKKWKGNVVSSKKLGLLGPLAFANVLGRDFTFSAVRKIESWVMRDSKGEGQAPKSWLKYTTITGFESPSRGHTRWCQKVT